jgi:hypothetical protein
LTPRSHSEIVCGPRNPMTAASSAWVSPSRQRAT